MDPNLQTLENPETVTPEDPNELAIVPSKPSSQPPTNPPPFAAASLSLSLSSNLLLSPKPSSIVAPQPTRVKIPSQVSSLTRLTLSAALALPRPLSFKPSSPISASPLQNPQSPASRRTSDPSNAAGLRRAAIVWFRNDLRLQDNECLNSANNDSVSVLPVYCFDPRDYGKSSSGFDKTGPYRATFLIESVSSLRRSLRDRGSDLVVRIGRPEAVLVELAKAVGADAVYAHREVSHDEVKAEETIEAVMKEEGVEVKYFWGSTLYHVEDLPFKLEDMPLNYGGFRDKVKGLEVRKTIEALDQLKGIPSRGDVEPGEIPTLLDLGLNPSAPVSQNGKANASMVGGETVALHRLKKFADECQAQPPNNSSQDSIYGANFSCKISPWLAMGCLSPRSMYDELKKTASRTFARKSDGNAPSDTGMNWLMYELLWRDFFRFITKKYSSAKRQLNAAPVTACTGALA